MTHLAQIHKRVRSSAPLFPQHEFFLHHRELHLTSQPCRGCSQIEHLSTLYDVYLHPFYGAVTHSLRSSLIQKVPTPPSEQMQEYPIVLVRTPNRPVYLCYQCVEMEVCEPFTESQLARAAEGHRIENENLRAEMRRRDQEEEEAANGRRAKPKPRIPALKDEEIF